VFYSFARSICRVVLLLLRRWEICGLSNLPAEGGLVLVSNHTSYWDPVVVGCAINRRVNYMAKSELFDIPLLSTFIRAVGTFPVRRNQLDRAAIRTAMKLLDEGQIVGVFPEGTRSHTGELLKPHLGAAMLALKAGVPFLPVAIKGSRGVLGKVRVNIGKPVFYQAGSKISRLDMEKASNNMMEQIADLLKSC